MHPVLSVVIPMYNEEDVLPLLVDRLRPVLEQLDATYEVLAVDDCSTDLTRARPNGLPPCLEAGSTNLLGGAG